MESLYLMAAMPDKSLLQTFWTYKHLQHPYPWLYAGPTDSQILIPSHYTVLSKWHV